MNQELSELDLKRSIHKDSYHAFLRDSFLELEPNNRFVDNWHYAFICKLIQNEIVRIANKLPSKYDVIIINIPPRTGKSYLISRALNAWVWGPAGYPWFKIISSSYSDKLATSLALATKRLIESPFYQQLYSEYFQLSEDMNNKARFDTNVGGMRYVTSTGGTVSGEGADLLIVDDPQNPLNANSEADRTTTNLWWDETFFNRLNDARTGVRIVVMQRLHSDDLTGHILKSGLRVKQISLPGRIRTGVTPKPLALAQYYINDLLFPKRFDDNELDKQRVALGPYGYAGQIEQSPNPRGGGKIKRSWFKIVKANSLPEDLVKYYYTDPAEGGKNSDEIASGCWSIYDGKIYIWGMLSAKVPMDQFIGGRNPQGEMEKKEYDYFVDRYGSDPKTIHFVEAKSLGQGYVSFMNTYTDYRAIPDNPGSASKVQRAYDGIPTMYAGRVVLVDGEWNEAFLQQVETFPVGADDGQVDVLSSIIRKSNLKVGNVEGDNQQTTPLTDEEKRLQAEREEKELEDFKKNYSF